MKIYLVWYGRYDYADVNAVYPTRELAEQHLAKYPDHDSYCGSPGYVEEHEVFAAVPEGHPPI